MSAREPAHTARLSDELWAQAGSDVKAKAEARTQARVRMAENRGASAWEDCREAFNEVREFFETVLPMATGWIKTGLGPAPIWQTYVVNPAVETAPEGLVAAARGGDALADRVLREAICRWTALKKPLPFSVASYLADVLCDRIDTETRGPRQKNVDRDYCIFRAVQMLTERGFKPTRNEATKQKSACAIVAEAYSVVAEELQLPGGALEEKNIVKIWTGVGRKLRLLGAAPL